mgnify:CR=1 FL=1
MLKELEVWLPPWSEMVGIYDGIGIEEDFTHVKINGKVISSKNGTKEATLLQQCLNEKMIGRKIGVLRTNLPDKPILIRMIDQKGAAKIERS